MFNQRIQIILALCVVYALSAMAVDCNQRPKKIDLHQCCPVPDMVTAEIKEKCKNFMKPEAKDGEGEHKWKGPGPRFMECFFNETGIYINRTLNQAKVDSYYGKVFASMPEMIPIVKIAYDTCVEKSEEMKAKWEERKMSRSTPAPTTDDANKQRKHHGWASKFLGFCVFKESFVNCPETIWSDADECNEVRDHMMNCKFQKKWGKHGNRGASSDEMPVEEEM